MDFNNLGTQIVIALVAIVSLWLLLKTMKIVWKFLLILLILLALSFALPAMREWILNFF